MRELEVQLQWSQLCSFSTNQSYAHHAAVSPFLCQYRSSRGPSLTRQARDLIWLGEFARSLSNSIPQFERQLM